MESLADGPPGSSWAPQRTLIAGQHDVALFHGVGEDLLVVSTWPKLGVQVNDPHDL
jgi:hypothetical protein